MRNDSGESLIEVIIAATVGILVVTALTFTTIFSLRNANFAKNSAQATKLAQEGIEKVKSIRDRDQDGKVYYYVNDGDIRSKFSQLWDIHFSCPSNCYFYFNSDVLRAGALFEDLVTFKRQVAIVDGTPADQQKTVTVTVTWDDPTGSHESKMITILRRI